MFGPIQDIMSRIGEIKTRFDVPKPQANNGDFQKLLASSDTGKLGEAENVVSNLPEDLDGQIQELSAQFGLDPALTKAVVKAESGFNPKAVSRTGAMGLMQLMPDTASSLGVDNPFSPEQNLAGGIKYLKELLGKYNGNIDLALAAYNAGPGKVAYYGGVPPFVETRNYVDKVKKYYEEYRAETEA